MEGAAEVAGALDVTLEDWLPTLLPLPTRAAAASKDTAAKPVALTTSRAATRNRENNRTMKCSSAKPSLIKMLIQKSYWKLNLTES
jgi:hypothetical protein